ncbi:muts domain V-domain-containing protein [Amylocarpus encephaloides]|uniref:DNA mismatch repair protein n=1 Tax=Amylocarpus encephaloides TaxID=45428 RepID=A0A9P7YHD7_9HELO|nr:muts domain V-domain-containing protein [Amylocarpus encephaloides]
MVKKSDSTAATPARPTSLKKQNSSTGSATGQRSIHNFFSKSPAVGTPNPRSSNGALKADETGSTANAMVKPKPSSSIKKPAFRKSAVKNSTPVPSSDAVGPSSSQENENGRIPEELDEKSAMAFGSSPARKAKEVVSYAESDDDDDEDAFDPAGINSRRKILSKKAQIPTDDEEEDTFVAALDEAVDEDDGMDDFVVDDDSDAPLKSSKKRKRPITTATSRKRSNVSPPPAPFEDDESADEEIPSTSTAQQWKYDPDNQEPLKPRSVSAPKIPTSTKKGKEKAYKSEPEKRYSWLANLQDLDRNPIGHPDYDPRTVYIPPVAFSNFSPFEKQYWEIKQKFFDTIVFFKKGKFYELYENDATIGHQMFDLKLTDRVNMRMVGVPEMSLDHWANQFVAKGYKIARVDQMESALGKEMREAEVDKKGKAGKVDKIIRRELACVLTSGTLVEGSMLQDDMATYCVAIKEGAVDDLPVFGVAFVDTATGQFFLSQFVDDVDLTKFETLVAQTRPQELLLEKSFISTKALRILKNNTGPTTIWNHLKALTEFWPSSVTVRELDCGRYFPEADGAVMWPDVLEEAKDKEFLMSAFGALTRYLRTLKLEKDLLSQGNFSWYDPIQKGSTLVLDGQTLINLEIFANTFDGSSEGTLFTLLNRCVTPFGKRMFRQWVCHPLADAARINERLNAVDMINADRSLSDKFIASMTRMPDLERLISRVHAGVCKPDDFVRVLDGFEQIEYTMSLLASFKGGEGIVDRLIKMMPNLVDPLEWWKTAFDRTKARDHKLLVPERGVEDEFDASQDAIVAIEAELDTFLKKARKRLGGNTNKINFKNLGKEIYQIEVPSTIKVPKDWQMMSSAGGLKRYYNSELRGLIRQLQEAQETHGQIVKQVAGRFYARFDESYDTWLQAIKVISQLDCLISLAAASSALGEPSCRPQFVEAERSVVEFEELRHPCMLPNVTDFIPNDVKLGGQAANINLLTGANAAGKSTILRMTCVAVIMAQIGCYVPCVSATLTPVDRIMSRLGANDNIFAAQSTFFVELSETKKILSEATPRSLVILDELGRGTSSYDGVAVAQAVLHHVATHIGCTGFFATHYHSLATEFAGHPEIAPKRMQIHVDDDNRQVTFLYKLEEGVAEGSFGMHCAAMCGIPTKVIDRAEVAARDWEHTSRLKESLEKARSGCYIPLGFQSDVSWLLKEATEVEGRGMEVLMKAIESL